ncbi:MAG: hypothetical protein AAF697_08070 [Pseudomonadota bacterium]
MIDAINSGAGSIFSPFHRGVTGGVYFGQVRLGWSTPLVENGFRPTFVGSLVEQPYGTLLIGSFGMGLWLRIFFSLWYFILLVMALVAIAGSFSPADSLPIAIIIPLFALFPIGAHFLFNWNADTHYAAIIDLLKRDADFEVMDDTLLGDRP